MNEQNQANTSPNEDVNTEMLRRSQEAVEMAATVYGESLDRTESSVEAVERILDSLGADRALTDDDRARVAWAYGPYLGEVARRYFPEAKWERFHSTYDQGGPYIQLGEIQVFPVLWCHKRLHNGPSDSVAHKYFAFRSAAVERGHTAESGAETHRQDT